MLNPDVMCQQAWSRSQPSPPDRGAHLLVDIRDGLLTFPVHIQDLQKGLVDALIVCEASLQHPGSMSRPEAARKCLCSALGARKLTDIHKNLWSTTYANQAIACVEGFHADFGKTHLDLVHVVDSLVELNGCLRLQSITARSVELYEAAI